MEQTFTQDELDQMAFDAKVEFSKKYLRKTDWVEHHIIRHELGVHVLPDTSNKLAIKKKRNECISFLQSLDQ